MTPAQPRFLASRCPACGAPKSRPSLTAYVYCDFCGALADYDFRKACEIPAQQPGPVYQNLVASLQKKTANALAAGDKSAYLVLQRQLYAAWVDACPSAVPPRVGDPDYRRAYVEHLALTGLIAAFDPDSVRLSATMNGAVAALKWRTDLRHGRALVEADSFAALLDAVMASLDHGLSDTVTAQLPPHPDDASPALQKRLSQAMFVQGWLPYLDEAMAQALLARTGLTQEYVTASPASGTTAHCGHCSAVVTVLSGARRGVCEACGHQLRFDRHLACDGCGADLLLDGGDSPVHCPHCRRLVERVAAPWPLGDVSA